MNICYPHQLYLLRLVIQLLLVHSPLRRLLCMLAHPPLFHSTLHLQLSLQSGSLTFTEVRCRLLLLVVRLDLSTL